MYLSIINLYLITSVYARVIYKTTQNSDEVQVTKKYVETRIRKIRTPEQLVKKSNINIEKNDKYHIPLVRKPIPQYIESNEGNEVKFNVIYTDQNDNHNENADSNVDIYDLEINEDEMAVRDKPFESMPSRKTKRSSKFDPIRQNIIADSINSREKILEPKTSRRVSRQTHGKQQSEDDDEFDLITTESTTKTSKTTLSEQDFTEEDDIENEFKETENARGPRSPWIFDSMTDNLNKNTVSKLLSFLPMFPKFPTNLTLKPW